MRDIFSHFKRRSLQLIRITSRRQFMVLGLVILWLAASTLLWAGDTQGKTVTGVVFEDANRNLTLDRGEKGVAGVLVSNQREVVRTDRKGRYSLPVGEETVIFITKPARYAVPLDENNLPRFYYIHQPKGSPPLKYPGVNPTGALPDAVNFPLFRTKRSKTFQVLVFGDTQPASQEDLDFYRDDIVAEVVEINASFGMTLGDIVGDKLELYDRYKELTSQIDIPFYNVPGNHDVNYEAQDDYHALETFKRHFGPPYYSFDYGQVHFIVLDDVEYLGRGEDGNVRYRGMIGAQQLQWLANDLELVPKKNLVVLTMHIPLYQESDITDREWVVDLEHLFQLLEGRERVLALAAHTHTIRHSYFGTEEGWRGKSPFHHIICGAACGAWWGGPLDERGLPVAEQSDGAPNGYNIFTFEGNSYRAVFHSADKGVEYQMRIAGPRGRLPVASLDSLQVIVNVFNGSERSVVEYRIDNRDFSPMVRTVMKDPILLRMHLEHQDQSRSWVAPSLSHHIWTADMPTDIAPGVHRIIIRTRDQYGEVHKRARVFEIE